MAKVALKDVINWFGLFSTPRRPQDVALHARYKPKRGTHRDRV